MGANSGGENGTCERYGVTKSANKTLHAKAGNGAILWMQKSSFWAQLEVFGDPERTDFRPVGNLVPIAAILRRMGAAPL